MLNKFLGGMKEQFDHLLNAISLIDVITLFNLHLHERVSEHRDQKYFGEVSFWPAEYRNRPPIVPFIFNFKNFGEF
jgi:hypothetical protein